MLDRLLGPAIGSVKVKNTGRLRSASRSIVGGIGEELTSLDAATARILHGAVVSFGG